MPKCSQCDVDMQEGILTVRGVFGAAAQSELLSNIVFRLPGEQTDGNPVKAFKQGLSDARSDSRFVVIPFRCPKCGKLECFSGRV